MNNDKTLALIALYAAVIAALGFLPKFTVPMAGGVPITMQSLGIMLAGVMLGPVRGFLAVCLFLLVVALGAPLLAGGRGGLVVFTQPTVGFLIGFPVAAFVAGLLMKNLSKLSVFWSALIASIVGGIIVLYAFGIPGIVLVAGLDWATAIASVTVFIPGDLIKAIVVGFVASTVARGLPESLLSRT